MLNLSIPLLSVYCGIQYRHHNVLNFIIVKKYSAAVFASGVQNDNTPKTNLQQCSANGLTYTVLFKFLSVVSFQICCFCFNCWMLLCIPFLTSDLSTLTSPFIYLLSIWSGVMLFCDSILGCEACKCHLKHSLLLIRNIL